MMSRYKVYGLVCNTNLQPSFYFLTWERKKLAAFHFSSLADTANLALLVSLSENQ